MDANSLVVVVGAGAAGLACAISAANQGASVALIEKTPHLGGTVTQSLIHTIGGLYDDQGNFVNPGLPVALVERLEAASRHTIKRKIGKTWTLSVDPLVYREVVDAWVERNANIHLYKNSLLTKIYEARGLIDTIQLATAMGSESLRPKVLIDATGTAEVVRMINPQLVLPGEALSGLIFQLRNVEQEATKFPQNIAYLRAIQKAVEQGILPSVCARTWLDVGIYEDEIYVKLNIPTALALSQEAEALCQDVANFLRRFPPFAEAVVGCIGQVGIRDGGRIRGEYCLTAADVRSGRKFQDAVCRSAWPIEYWDPSEGVMLEYLPLHQSYQIPLRSLRVLGMKNLWAVGKCLSAEKLAQASARVAGTCWALGDGLGKVVAKDEFV